MVGAVLAELTAFQESTTELDRLERFLFGPAPLFFRSDCSCDHACSRRYRWNALMILDMTLVILNYASGLSKRGLCALWLFVPISVAEPVVRYRGRFQGNLVCVWRIHCT